jgi:hypothetical protein
LNYPRYTQRFQLAGNPQNMRDRGRYEAYNATADGARWGLDRMDTSARARDSSPLNISTIGEDLTITGNVTSKGELHVNGRVQGDVHCVALVLGENAQVESQKFTLQNRSKTTTGLKS